MPSSFLHPFTPPRKDSFLSITGGKDAVVFDMGVDASWSDEFVS